MVKDKRRAELEKFLAQSKELPAPPGTPTEQVIWLVLARHGSKDGAEKAFRALWKRFVDVNEFRVAKASEVASIIGRSVRGDAVRVAEEAQAVPAEGKPKKRTDKDLAALVDRMRLACAVAAKGEVVAKVREAQATRGLVAAWEPGSAPEAPPMDPAPPPEPPPIPTHPPEEFEEPEEPATSERGGKTAPRPHTTREARARQDKRSSRR